MKRFLCCILTAGLVLQAAFLFAFNKNDLETLLRTGACKNCDLQAIDFSGKSSEGISIDKGDLSKSLFRGTIFTHSFFRQVKFNECDLVGAVFDGSELEKCIFKKSILNGVGFSGVKITKTEFSLLEMKNVSFKNASLRYCEFSECDLSGSDLRGADLTGSGFAECDFTGVLTDSETIGPGGEKGWMP
ncbi:MAG: pentapeptide repeat-containing protein [Spirochaetales bacterium]|nr:pentapeptide repeat-containing protein [Spirochaetales bacterium]